MQEFNPWGLLWFPIMAVSGLAAIMLSSALENRSVRKARENAARGAGATRRPGTANNRLDPPTVQAGSSLGRDPAHPGTVIQLPGDDHEVYVTIRLPVHRARKLGLFEHLG